MLLGHEAAFGWNFATIYRVSKNTRDGAIRRSEIQPIGNPANRRRWNPNGLG